MPGYISEFKYYGLSDEEFIEVAVPTGTDVSAYSVVLYQGNGTIVESYALGYSQGTYGNQDVYVIDGDTTGFSSMSGSGEMYSDDALALVDDTGAVVQFISYWGNTVTAVEGPAAGMTSTDVGTASDWGSSLQSDDGGATYYQQYDTNKDVIPACYAPGSRITTPDGFKLVEELQAGDLVETRNQQTVPVLWVWSGRQPLDDVALHQKPVLLGKNSLAPGVPNRDLIVSGQHRIAVGIYGQLEDAFPTAAFVPAKALVGLPGIRHMAGKRSMQWHHFYCADHQVVFANDVASESLLLGAQILSHLDAQHIMNLSECLVGSLGAGQTQELALPALSRRKTLDALNARRRKRHSPGGFQASEDRPPPP